MKLIRVMRLWRNGYATAVWTGYNLQHAFYFVRTLPPGRLWIDYADQPARPKDLIC